MAFLDRSTLIVDAILTSKGREKLSSSEFEIEKFGNSTIDKVPEWQFYGWRSIRHKVVINDDANSSDNCCNIR